MNALDILKAVASARHTLEFCEQRARANCPDSPALASLTIARRHVEAAEETIEESLCSVCDREGHDESACPANAGAL